eukprot:CAMPEP_0178386728 /NCGR_PEP_ID=MMETSP0689_2-20121128/8709_1 /TAXON_ID=160604 /ORGANISM="Amphidinium massartii, Strain CS-259" /LENGTH=219 /DNA_ID=CAMNT_0020007073 /DNA_START=15 /DNA_END=671 /DNA_ORIENTATION=-
MPGGHIQAWLENSGLQPTDVPKAMGILVGAKYAYVGAAVLLGIRYHPLQRILLSRSEAAIDKTRRGRLLSLSSMVSGHFREARQSMSRQRVVAWAARKHQEISAGNALRATKYSKRFKEARQSVQRHHRELKLLKEDVLHRQRTLEATWKAWVSKKYWKLADSLERTLARSQVMSLLSSNLGFQPRNVALGVAEGVLLAKLAAPVTIPVTLLVIVQVLK